MYEMYLYMSQLTWQYVMPVPKLENVNLFTRNKNLYYFPTNAKGASTREHAQAERV